MLFCKIANRFQINMNSSLFSYFYKYENKDKNTRIILVISYALDEKDIKFKFELIDYTSTYNLNWLNDNKKTFINISNIFNYVSGCHIQSLKYRIACENRLILNLISKNPEITLFSTLRAASGFIENTSSVYLGKVKDCKIVDMNNLKKPRWHSIDWQSIKLLD